MAGLRRLMTRGAYAVALAALVCAAMVPAMIPSTAASVG